VNDAADITSHIPRLRRYARALTGDSSAADDLVQDTLERAWRRLALWRTGSDLRAWLFTIMHNIFVNQSRADPRKLAQATALAGTDLSVTTPQEDRLILQDLNKALRNLPHDQREVLLLIGLEQMTYEEAAKVIGIPVGTVMSRLSRGREQLRAMMSGIGAVVQLKVVK
jgi:RNA polymerase sigma-70 factor (ECF subfamily)